MGETSQLINQRFPGGTYTLPRYEAWLWADAATARMISDAAHPGIAYMIGLHGGGASIQQIMDMLGTSADAGVQFGEVRFEFGDLIRADTTYHVDGEVLDVVRKHGRRMGAFDLVTFVHRLRAQPDGDPVATVTHTWVVPRPEAPA